jgi:nucleoid DNA-binding protein
MITLYPPRDRHMNKSDLSKKLSEESNIPFNAVKVIVDTIFDSMAVQDLNPAI